MTKKEKKTFGFHLTEEGCNTVFNLIEKYDKLATQKEELLEKLDKIKYVVAEKSYPQAEECDYGHYNECANALIIKDIEQILKI